MESKVEQLFTQSTPAEIDADRDDILLNQDPAAWQTEVHQALVQTVGLPPEAVPVVEIQMEDEEQGDASGAVTIDVHGQQLVVPVVIRQGSLAPMDVFFLGGKEEDVRPLTTQNVNELMSQGQYDYKAVSAAGSGGNGSLVDQTLLGGSGNMDQLQGPFGSEYGGAKYAAVSDSIIVDLDEHAGISKEAIGEFRSELDRDSAIALDEMPTTSTRFGEPVFGGGITKLNMAMRCLSRDRDYAARMGSRHDVPAQQAMNPSSIAATDVYQIRLVGPGRYRLHATCDRVFIPMVRDLDGSEVRSLLESVCARYSRRERHDVGRVVQSFAETLLRKGEITIVTRSRPTKPAVLWPDRNVVEDLSVFARYHVRQEGGLGDMGVAFPGVYDCDGSRLPAVVFVSERTGNWAMQESMVGVRDGLEASPLEIEKLDEPGGRRVLLTWIGADGKPCCLPPVELERVEKVGESVAILAKTGLGESVRLICDAGVNHPISSSDGLDEQGRQTYLFPMAHAAVRICKRNEYTTTTAAFEKMGSLRAAENGEVRELRIVPAGGGAYNVKLGSFVQDGMSHSDARLFLATCGASHGESRMLLDKAAELAPSGLVAKTEMPEPITTMEEVEKLASLHVVDPSDEERAAAGRLIAMVKEAGVVKLAASMPDAASADQVLSTRFVNAENITVFKRYIPEFRKTVARLGRLLIFARLSGQLDESVLKRGMTLLDQVIREVQQITQTHIDETYA